MASPTQAQDKAGKDDEKDLWSTLLDSVSSGKRLPDKYVIVIGGSPEMQRDFLDTLDSEAVRRPQDQARRQVPIANEFALGFTYQDVLDADHEDTLARLSIYTLPQPPDAFMALVKPLLTTRTIPDTALVLLLDWAEPWNWHAQVRDWLRLFQQVTGQLDDEARQLMDEIMQDWQQRRRGPVVDGATQAPNEPNVNVPLGAGEWDEPLGIPVCVVCHGVEKMEALEKEHGWREEDFDFVLQFLRTVLLKHGASLVYTANTSPNSLPALVQSTLGIQSLLKRNPLKHNVVDREKILIPPNWDSWGKIKVLREGFDLEGVSDGWSLEVQPPRSTGQDGAFSSAATNRRGRGEEEEGKVEAAAVVPTKLYAETIRDPQAGKHVPNFDVDGDGSGIETHTPSMQDFLAAQQPVIEQLRQEDEAAASADPKQGGPPEGTGYADGTGRVNEHIGPVQFNMGGIQVDAEDALQRLRRGRESGGTPEPDLQRQKSGAATPSGAVTGTATPESKAQNEALASFFAGLVKKTNNRPSSRPPPSS